MSEESWAIVITGALAVLLLGAVLERISKQLDRLIEIAHRIRINDRRSDF